MTFDELSCLIALQVTQENANGCKGTHSFMNRGKIDDELTTKGAN